MFLVGLFGAVGLLAAALLNSPGLWAATGGDLGTFGRYLQGVRGTGFLELFVAGVASLVFFLAGSRLIHTNLFSLHAMYANRLTRCYLGASRPSPLWRRRWSLPRDPQVLSGAPSLSSLSDPELRERSPNPETNFDPNDDLRLSDLIFAHNFFQT